ncbi:MAG TPA: transcriptional regulator, partial [Bacteroidetes bacterium]|nr:transcriptional regulator [Bacteroidota bacterium]
MTTIQEFEKWLQANEDEHLEFKKAKNNFPDDSLIKYCCALANERGGRLILGVTNEKPRSVVGTRAYQDLNKPKSKIMQSLPIRVEVDELYYKNARVLIFHVPSRPVGMALNYKGRYLWRRGEEVVDMPPNALKQIFDEAVPDYSAEICTRAKISDLDPDAIEALRIRWHRKSNNNELLNKSPYQLLADAELIVEGQITYAALILLGKHEALGRFLGQAEVIFEYRSNEASIEWQDRREYREGFFLFDDELWNVINSRNEVQHFHDGLFVWDIDTFNEKVIREALLNAISHRDYRLGGSIFVRQYPRKIEIVSPGGFPEGINSENIIDQQNPRNRRITEVLGKCGLVERAGQGADIMFRESIKESKPVPDYSRTDDSQVFLILSGTVQDPQFLRYLEKIGEETLASFTTEDFLVLDCVRRQEKVPENLNKRMRRLRELGLIEIISRGRGTRYILSKSLYITIEDKAGYTKQLGLDRETNKELILQHIKNFKGEGSPLSEILKVLPELSYAQVRMLLQELKNEGKIYVKGKT